MALEGSLKEFNVADILQLIFFQKKAGALILQGRSDRVRILFHDGNIVGAESRRHSLDRRLVWVLARRGMLSQEKLDASVAKAKAEGGKFLHHIVKDGVVSKEDVQKIYTFLITETMVKVFSMKEGRYEFKPQAIPLDKELGVVLNTEHFLMEGVRLLDEWSELEGRITHEDIFHRDPEEDIETDENEERVLPYVDGVLTVSDIADLAGIDSFTVASALLSLMAKKAVFRMGPEPDDAPKEKPKPRPIPYLEGIIGTLGAIAFAASMAVYFKVGTDTSRFDASEQLYDLRLKAKAEFALTGRLPDRVEGIDPWGRPYAYTKTAGGFTLMSPGPDGQSGTPDDIH